MCFFRDQEDFFESKAASSPVMIYQASVELAGDYTKRKFVFRLHTSDGSEFLFGADNEEQQVRYSLFQFLNFYSTFPCPAGGVGQEDKVPRQPPSVTAAHQLQRL